MYKYKLLLIGVLYGFFMQSINAQQSVIDSLSNKLSSLRNTDNFSETDTVYIKTFIKYGAKHRHINKDTLISVAKKVLELSQKIKYDYGIVSSYQLHGHFYAQKDKNSKAIYYYDKALKAYEQWSNKIPKQKLYILNSKAQEYEYLSEYAKSLNNLMQGVDLATKYNYDYDLTLLNQNIAYLYISQKYFEQGLEYYENSIRINEKLGDEQVKAETLSCVADIYYKIDKLPEAMLKINNCIPVFEKHQNLMWLAYAYEVKAKIYLKKQDYGAALDWFTKSMIVHNKIDDKLGEITVIDGLAQSHLGLKSIDSSYSNAIKSFTLSKNIGYIKGEIASSSTLFKYYKTTGDYKEALYYKELNMQLSDSLYRDANKNGLELLKVKFDYENEKELFLRENKKALAKKSLIIYLIIGLVIILGIIIFVIKRNQNKYIRLNTVLKRKRKELTEINNTKNKLFSIIGHDLTGPMGSLKSLLDLHSKGKITEEDFFLFIPKIKSNVDSLFFTLNNLLSWGNSQINGAHTKPTNTKITDLVESAIKLLAEIIEKKAITISNTISEDVIVWADYNQTEVIIRNLLSNATKFTPENGKISFVAIDKGDFYRIEIKDSGVGMTKEIQEKIFLKTSNITTYGTNNEKGTGLGLTLCKEMIEKNSGTIGVDSQIAKGTTFYFTLPKYNLKK